MNYLLVLCSEGEIFELELLRGDSIAIGSGEDDALRLDRGGLKPGHLTLSSIETGIHATSLVPMSIKEVRATNRVLAVGDVVRLSDNTSLSIFEKRCDIDDAVYLADQSEITLGRSGRNDICMDCAQVSSNHAVLRRYGDGWLLEDQGSRNGTFVDGKAVKSAALRDNTVIFMGGWRFIFRDNALCFDNTAGPCAISSRLKRVSGSPAAAAEARYPFFQRSPRLIPETETLEVEILSPPNAGSKPSISWLSVLLPPIMMILMMVGVSFAMGQRSMLYYTVPMSGISIVVSVVNYKSQMKKWAETQKLARDKYEEHMKEKEAIITEAETDFLKALDIVNPSAYECASIVARIDRRLWERTVWDDDFLSVRLGTRQVDSNVNIKIPSAQLSIEEDPLLVAAQRLKERHSVLTGVPVTHSFASSTVTGLAGGRSAIRKMAWTILTGVAANYSYEDVKIVCVYPESERSAWDWTRWLPHVWNENRARRYIACTSKHARPLLRELGDMLKARRRSVGENNDKRMGPEMPFYFLMLADKTLTEESGAQLLPDLPSLGMTVVYAYGEMGLLPGECQAIVNCDDTGCSLQVKAKASGRVHFTPDRISLELVDAFARNMAPIRLRQVATTAAMPNYVTFLQGYGVTRVESLDVAGRWARSRPFQSIAAPIGIRENGELFSFDIHEKGMGPHGIVAGATRWGKSETLTTWLLSVALNYYPGEVSFVLIDFKGDGLSGILMDLPHVAGIISNIDDMASIERNLRSLQGELLRRQRVFKETKLENIHKYQEAYRNGKAPEPMAYLIVVIDEFAELKTQFPDQMNEFISIARVGGSLGVYMVLATQSPGGIVAGQVSANSRFRICLKTSEAGESKDILGTTDAYHVTVRGRAYVKVGNNEVYEQVQTFYSKAPYQPEAGAEATAAKINIVEMNGERSRPKVYDKTVGAAVDDSGEGRAVSWYIQEAALENDVPRARPVWTEALPERISLSALLPGEARFHDGIWPARREVLSIVAGLVDDPEWQKQYPLVLDFAEDGHQILYGAPSSGKTTFLQTVLVSAAMSYAPDAVQFVAFDFGSGGMRALDALPHAVIVADANDAEKMKRAEDYLVSELASRKERFSNQGVGTLEAYREVTGEAVPAILIAIDNIASMYDMYPDILDSIIAIAREGGSLGLYLLITAGSQSGFMYRIAQYVTISYALQLTDRSDYRQLVGGNGRMEPGHFPGRGFARGPLEFQTALCVDGEREGERVKQLRAICQSMKDAWKGEPVSVQTAPKEIDAALLTLDGTSVQIGYDKVTAAPYDFVLRDMNGAVISGAPSSGKSNALGWIVRALREDSETAVYIYEKGSFLGSLHGGAKSASDGTVFDAYLSELGEEYDRRTESGADCPRIALCVDDFIQFYEEISEESAGVLDVIIRYGGDHGIYVYIAGDQAGLTRFRHLSVKVLESCLAGGNAIALGGRLKSHNSLDGLYTGDDMTLSEREGCVIHGGAARRVRFAKVRDEAVVGNA